MLPYSTSAREGTDLFNRRDTVDYLFYVQPVALGLVKKAINWVKFWVYDKPLVRSAFDVL